MGTIFLVLVKFNLASETSHTLGCSIEISRGIYKVHVSVLNEKVGFKRPTTRYRNNSISCGALHSGTAQWTSGVGWSFDL